MIGTFPGTIEAHKALCLDIASKHDTLFKKMELLRYATTMLLNFTRNDLLLSFLDDVVSVLNLHDKNSEFVHYICDTLVNRLLDMWIFSDCKEQNLWSRFEEKVSSLFFLPKVLSQCRVRFC